MMTNANDEENIPSFRDRFKALQAEQSRIWPTAVLEISPADWGERTTPQGWYVIKFSIGHEPWNQTTGRGLHIHEGGMALEFDISDLDEQVQEHIQGNIQISEPELESRLKSFLFDQVFNNSQIYLRARTQDQWFAPDRPVSLTLCIEGKRVPELRTFGFYSGIVVENWRHVIDHHSRAFEELESLAAVQ